MKKLVILISLFWAASLSAQPSEECEFNLHCKVTAPSGLTLRDGPSLKARVITYAPQQAKVDACQQVAGKLTVEGIEGNWRRVQYQDQLGYMFDGFLEVLSISPDQDAEADSLRKSSQKIIAKADSLLGTETESAEQVETHKPVEKRPDPNAQPYLNGAQTLQFVTETYNYCGAVDSLDPGLLWYGIYPDKEDNPTGNFRIKPAALTIKLSKRKLGNKMEFDIVTEESDRSIFLIGLSRPLKSEQINIKDHSDVLRIKGRKVFPGQELKLGGAPNMSLSATGAVESSGDCPQLKNYRLTLKGKVDGKNTSQDIMKLIGAPGQCGMPELYWYGDFTGDGIPEVIFVSVYEQRNVFTLLTSLGTQAGKLLEKQAAFTVEKCYAE